MEKEFLSQASPTKIISNKTAPIKRESLLLADIPDIHYGLRRLPDGSLRPTHRPEVMDVWLQIMKDQQPDTIIIGGDAIDLPEVSRFERDSNHFVDTTQLCIDGLYKYLSRVRADNPRAKIIHLKGNHCERFNKYMIRNAMPLFGMKPADMPDSWAVNSYPFLLRLDDLDIQWLDSYKINDRLTTEHGEYAVNGSTAAKYLGKLAISMMFHHSHRREYGRRTFPDGKSIEAFSFGCQADTTGSVPSYKSNIDDRGYVTEKFENWDNGAGFIRYQEGDKPFQVEAVAIDHQNNYEATYNGRVYNARKAVVEALSVGQ